MSKNVVLTDANGEQILPITASDNVFVEDNLTLTEKLKNLTTMKDTPLTFKGSCTFETLPTNAKVGDYWYCSDKLSAYSWNGSAWIDLGNIVNGDYDQLKSDLDCLRTQYKNLFNKDNITKSKYVDSGGNLQNGSGIYDLSDWIKTNGYFRVSYESTGNPIFRIAFYDENKVFQNRLDFTQADRTFRREWTGYIRIILFTSNNSQEQMNYDSIMITHGSDIVPYSPYYTAHDRFAREEIKKLSKTDRIAMFGDSITMGAINGLQTQYGLPYWVEKMTGCDVENYAIGSQGWTVAGSDNLTAIENIRSHDLSDFDVITLQYGINDSNAYLGTYLDTTGETIMAKLYETVSYLYTTYPNSKVIVIAPTNTTNKGESPRWRLDATMLRGYTAQDMIDEYKKFCNYYCVPFISYENCPVNSFNIVGLLSDTIHPNEKGYKLYGKYLANRLMEYIN